MAAILATGTPRSVIMTSPPRRISFNSLLRFDLASLIPTLIGSVVALNPYVVPCSYIDRTRSSSFASMKLTGLRRD